MKKTLLKIFPCFKKKKNTEGSVKQSNKSISDEVKPTKGEGKMSSLKTIEPSTAVLGDDVVSQTSLFTEGIAYKIPVTKIKDLIYVDGSDTVMPNLIGLQFEFKKIQEDDDQEEAAELVSEIKISKITYKATVEGLQRIPTGEKLLTHVFPIIENSVVSATDEEISFSLPKKSLDPGEPSEGERPYPYEALDHFDESIVLVFFSVAQLIPFINYYNFLTISGCQLNFGKKLSAYLEKEGTMVYDDKYFSLKIEGLEPKDFVVGSGDTSHVGSGVIVGPPCPPYWHTFAVITGIVGEIDPPALSRLGELKEQWVKNCVESIYIDKKFH